MFRNEEHYRKQVQYLPVRHDVSVKEQFGFLPISVIKPSTVSIDKWKMAHFNDDEIDTRKNHGGYGKNGEIILQKMSEFHAGVAENILNYWSMPGAKVVDPFSGRVTRAVVTTKCNREYYGYEISPRTYNRALKHFDKLNIKPNLFLANGCLLEHTTDEFADLIYTCPPYYNIEKYESADGQLSDVKTYDEFMQMINLCATNCYRVSKPGSFCVWVVGDFRDGGKLIDFHGDVKSAFESAGYLYHDIIIMENISPFAALTQYQAACKRYVPKTHEYIIVFRKPGEYIIPEYCSQNTDPIYNKHSKKFFEF